MRASLYLRTVPFLSTNSGIESESEREPSRSVGPAMSSKTPVRCCNTAHDPSSVSFKFATSPWMKHVRRRNPTPPLDPWSIFTVNEVKVWSKRELEGIGEFCWRRREKKKMRKEYEYFFEIIFVPFWKKKILVNTKNWLRILLYRFEQ